ncbi:putative oxidoreductase YccK [Branchiostoma floridae x Branchiostoma belcheri]
MERRQLANTDLHVSPVCLGAWQFNEGKADETWPAQDEQVSKDIVNKAFELGVNFFDTAEAYGRHASERVLGRALEGRRRDAIVATKFGAIHKRYTAVEVESSLQASLQALQTDYVDLYQVHWAMFMSDASEVVGELKRQQAKGRIRHYGVCNFGAKQLAEFCEAGGECATNQVAYNLLWRAVEYEVVPACAERSVSVLSYSPLQQGLLSGRFHAPQDVPEGRRRTRHFSSQSTYLSKHCQGGEEAATFQAISSLRDACAKEGVPMSSAALSWLLGRQGVASVIVGCRTPQQLEDNCKLAKLSQEFDKKLTEATEDLKERFGPDPDMWAKVSRYN